MIKVTSVFIFSPTCSTALSLIFYSKASHDRMISEQWLGNDMEENDRSLSTITPTFAWNDWRKLVPVLNFEHGASWIQSSVLQTRTWRSVVHIYQENKMDVHDTSSWKVPEYRTRSISKPGIALKILNAGSWRFACSNLHSKSETHTARFSFTWIALLAKLPITQSALKAEASASGKLQCTAPVMLTL